MQRAVVGRPLDEDARSALEQEAGEQGQALQRAVRDEHLRRLDGVPCRDPLAKGRIAADRPVVEDGGAVALDRRAGAVGQLLDGRHSGAGTPRANEIVAMGSV